MECSRPIQHPRQGMSANVHTEPGVHETRDAPVVGVSTNTRPALGHSTLQTAIGRCTLVGMQIRELTAVEMTAAPLPPPPSLRRSQASTSPRLA
jgi:hypothetical protein